MFNVAIEHGHRNSGFSHEKWWFSHQLCVSLPEAIFLGITLVYPHPIAMRIRPQHGDSPQHARAQQGPAAKSYPKAPQDDPGVNLEF